MNRDRLKPLIVLGLLLAVAACQAHESSKAEALCFADVIKDRLEQAKTNGTSIPSDVEQIVDAGLLTDVCAIDGSYFKHDSWSWTVVFQQDEYVGVMRTSGGVSGEPPITIDYSTDPPTVTVE